MTNITPDEHPHRKGCICLGCEAAREGRKAGAKAGRAIGRVLAKAIKPRKPHKCLRCGAGPEWLE